MRQYVASWPVAYARSPSTKVACAGLRPMPANTAFAFVSRPLSAVAAKVTGRSPGGVFSTSRTCIASIRRPPAGRPVVRPSCTHGCHPRVATFDRYSTR